MNKEETVLILNKKMLDEIQYDYASTVYNWCRRNKIKIEEPFDKKTERYAKFVIHLDTIEKQFLFSNRFLTVVKHLTKHNSQNKTPQP